ncbi:MAG: hypothetical protein LBG60_16610, partial [Bifidobacteriaceae bacterium]|nr:hypothetical protein [Bifidobacteriaceae bacterium]
DAADAADADRPPAGGAEPAADAARPARRLVVAARPAPVRPGDWLVIDLPTGEAAIPVRALAKELALAGAQAYELVRLGGGQVILVAHGVARPEAVGPALDPVPGSRPWLEAGPAASDAEILAACNATVLGPAQNSGAAAAMAQRYLAEVAPLRDRLADRAAELQARAERAEADVERLKGELTARYAREDALRARLARGPWYRLRRKLGRIAARRRAS